METKLEIAHRTFRDDPFWQKIPAWKNVSSEQFGDYKWQLHETVTKLSQIKEKLGGRVSDAFFSDVEMGLHRTPMNIRITPYIFSLIDWDNPTNDPLRKQFLPIASQFLPDHPYDRADSLSEDVDSPVEMLTHRYPDKVLFLPLTTCPVYCSYCTRSRIIGGSTEVVHKDTYGANAKRWDAVFDYLKSHAEVEDVVVSGGDAFNLRADQLKYIGESLIAIPHIRRFRYATKGLAVLPQKILNDDEWLGALLSVHKLGRENDKQVFVHTHFSSPQEISEWSRKAAARLFSEGVLVRNQAVLQTGVNNSLETMRLLIRKLSYMNIQPYYVYMHDMVPGCEHFRTTLREGIQLERALRGSTAGFNTPAFVCDAPGGGGKRPVSSFEYYDEENGISVWSAPAVKPGKFFCYFDPIHRLGPQAQKRWGDVKMQDEMVAAALGKVKKGSS